PIDEETPLTSAMSDDPDRRRAEESMFGSDDDPIERRDDSAGGSSDDNAPMTDAERREADMFGDDDASDREDEMFGGDDDGTDREEAIFGGREDPFGGSETSGGSLFDSALLEDPLAIGGQLFMRLDYTYRDEDDLETSQLRSPNLLDIYLDARPNDRLRAYIRGRLRHDFTVNEGDISPQT